MSKRINNSSVTLLVTGVSSLVAGMFYIPMFPWYLLGDVKESEIVWWGLVSSLGGVITVSGAALLMIIGNGARKVLLPLGAVGMAFILLVQLPAIFSWLIYGSAFTKQWSIAPWIGALVGFSLHGWLVQCALISLFSIVKKLVRIDKEEHLNRKQWFVFGSILLVCAGLWTTWDRYQANTWIAFTNPADGAVQIPRDITVTAQWKGQRGNNLGMKIRYSDAPDLYIPGSTGATMYGMSFKPEQPFLPDKTVNVTVEAGRRSYTSSFSTAND